MKPWLIILIHGHYGPSITTWQHFVWASSQVPEGWWGGFGLLNTSGACNVKQPLLLLQLPPLSRNVHVRSTGDSKSSVGVNVSGHWSEVSPWLHRMTADLGDPELSSEWNRTAWLKSFAFTCSYLGFISKPPGFQRDFKKKSIFEALNEEHRHRLNHLGLG